MITSINEIPRKKPLPKSQNGIIFEFGSVITVWINNPNVSIK